MTDVSSSQANGPSDRANLLLDTVRELVAEVHAHDMMRAGPTLDSTLDRDLGLDSLARVELLSRVEQRFCVHIPETAYGRIATVRELLQELEHVQPSQGAPEAAVHAVEGSEPAPETTSTVTHALLWHARRHPDVAHVIFTDGERESGRLTYGMLEAKALGIAGMLCARGIGAEDRVALMLPTDTDFLACFFAVLFVGGIPVPLYPPPGTRRVEQHVARAFGILANCGARMLIASPEMKPYTRVLRARMPAMREVVEPADLTGTSALASPSVQRETALLQYTSGSTGDPKGVVLTHANLLANIRAMGRAIAIGREDVFVSWLPLYHDMGLIGAWLGSLYFGTPLVLMSPFSFLQRPHRWLRSIQRYRGTLSGGPNFAYELCLKRVREEDLPGLDLSSWRFAFNGAEAVSATTVQRFSARYAPYGFDARACAPVYGLAECSVGLAFTPAGRGPTIDSIDRAALVDSARATPAAPGKSGAMQVVGCGYALPEHGVRIVDNAGETLPDRCEGRIQFTGPSATHGYFNNEAATLALFAGPWLDSGDLGYLVDGELYPTGRVKDLIIRAGRHYHPEEIEEAVGRLPGVRQGCVVAFGTANAQSGTEELVIVAETREKESEREQALRIAINALAIELLGTPADRVILAPPHTVPKTSSGKVRRAATVAAYERGLLVLARHLRVLRRAGVLLRGAAGSSREAARSGARWSFAIYAWALVAALAAVAAPVLALPLAPTRHRAFARRAARMLARLARLTPVVTGLDALHSAGEPSIIVVNHASYVDAIVLTAALPVDFRFVAKLDLASRWPLGELLRAVDAVLVQSLEPQHALEAGDSLVQAASEAVSLAVFPEGTFRRAPGVLPFHLGAFVAAARSGRSVVPVALSGTRSLLPDGTWLPRRSLLRVALCEPIVPKDTSFRCAVAARDAARAAIARACGEGLAM